MANALWNESLIINFMLARLACHPAVLFVADFWSFPCEISPRPGVWSRRFDPVDRVCFEGLRVGGGFMFVPRSRAAFTKIRSKTVPNVAHPVYRWGEVPSRSARLTAGATEVMPKVGSSPGIRRLDGFRAVAITNTGFIDSCNEAKSRIPHR
jgi:hypothetical protein